MLSNAYFLAKFRFDTAENEPAKICKIFEKCIFEKCIFEKCMRCDAMRDATALRAHRPGSAQGCSAPATKPLHEPINFEESKSNPVRVETKTNESRFMYIGQRIDQSMFRSESIRNFKFM